MVVRNRFSRCAGNDVTGEEDTVEKGELVMGVGVCWWSVSPCGGLVWGSVVGPLVTPCPWVASKVHGLLATR